MSSVNERIREELVAHGIGLDHYGNGLVQRMVFLLNQADGNLLAVLDRALAGPGPFRPADLDARLASIQPENEAAYQAVYDALLVEIRSLVAYEIEFQEALFSRLIPAEVLDKFPLARVSADKIFARVVQEPFQGGTLRGWITGATENRLKAIRAAVLGRYAADKAPDEIIGGGLGDPPSFAAESLDGSRRGLAAIIRSVLALVVSAVSAAIYAANASLVGGLQWVSVLDSRTTPMCRVRAGKCYTTVEHQPIGHAIPWGAGPGLLHFCCRSRSAPIFKSANDLLGEAQFSPDTGRSMDGQVPPAMSFGDWLARQTAERQDEVLGPTRGRLYRQGGMSAEAMYANRGEYLTLDQLRDRDEAAFSRAGL